MKKSFLTFSVVISVFGASALSAQTSFAASPGAVDSALQSRAAELFVLSSPLSDVFKMLDRSIRRDKGATLDHPLNDQKVLQFAIRNPEFMPTDVPHLLELAEIKFSKDSKSSASRLDAFVRFIKRGVIAGLREDAVALAVAKELNHEIGERFDRAQRHWSQLSLEERENYARLLGLSAAPGASAAYIARVKLFSESATSGEFNLFTTGLLESAGLKVLPIGLPADGGLSRGQFAHAFFNQQPFAERLRQSSLALMHLKRAKWTASGDRAWALDQTLDGLNTVFEKANKTQIHEALSLIEDALQNPRAAKPGEPTFTDLVLSPRLRESLEVAAERIPALETRIESLKQEISQQAPLLVREQGRAALERITTEHARKNEIRRFFSEPTCKMLFGP